MSIVVELRACRICACTDFGSAPALHRQVANEVRRVRQPLHIPSFPGRESLRDGVYAVPGFLIIPAGKSNARFIGHRPGTEVRWQANRHLWFQADYGIFYAGKFVKESQPGRNLNYWALWAGYKF